MTNMETTCLSEIFNIVYGNQLDLNKLEVDLEKGINFISRSRENLGVQTKVKYINGKAPFSKGSITVTLGGTYLLSSFVQQKDFYTAQNIKILTPKYHLSDVEKKFYCYVIEHNRFRYTSHGREANKTLNYLPVPTVNSIPNWVSSVKTCEVEKTALINEKYTLSKSQWKYYLIKNIFDIKKGNTPKHQEKGMTRLISATSLNNGVSKLINTNQTANTSNVITVSSNGDVGDAFYQSKDFFATGDVNILIPKFRLNPYIAIFLNVIIRQEKFRFNYGRKWGKAKILEHKIKLPTKNNQPDWKFMENYIKSLPYSRSL